MALQKSIELLDPEFKKLVIVFLKALDDANIPYIINETKREKAVQSAYHAQGREPLVTVNRLRKMAGLWEISEEENKKKITWTLESKHLVGKAIDIVPKKDGKAWWTAPDEKWREIAEISTRCGLISGYYWRSKDSPHHEME